jgi:N utilization substance protein B
LRIKVLQALYAWYTTDSDNLTQGEKQLFLSINKLYELFIFQLSYLVEIKRFAIERIEENKHKFYPTDDDLNPNMKFVENKVNRMIEDNRDFQRKEQAFKVRWGEEKEMVRKSYKHLIKFDFFKTYLSNNKSSLDEDKKLYLKIVDKLLPNDDLLKSYYEEKSVYFVDGYDLVLILLIKFFDTLTEDFNPDSPIPGLYKSADQLKNEDVDFVKILYKKVILNDKELTSILESKTSTWDYDRIPIMDIILLKMAIIELKEIETVPVKVTLNEYIEMTKYFSTEKSKTFVNGVLDRLIREFKDEGKIRKIGRGLIE